MIVTVDSVAGTVRKGAETSEEADRLRQEAQVLDVARHPGVVQLLGAGTGTVTLRLVDGVPLSRLPTASPAAFARITVDAATTLADLHDLGIVHGSISADHILVDSAGRTFLCSFGRARLGVWDGGEAAADVAALARVLAAAAPTGSDIEPVLRAATGAPGGPGPARRLAILLTTPLDTRRRRRRRGGRPAASRRAPSAGGHSSARPRSKVRVGMVGVALAVVVTAVALALAVPTLATASNRRRDPCPVADHGCRPLAGPGGVIQTAAGRYRLGRPGDLVVVGRWHCGDALPALLRPETGEVWVWDSWAPPNGALAARLLARVPRARTISVAPGASGCDGLRVQRRAGEAVAIRSVPQP